MSAVTIACAPMAQADPCNNQACLQSPFSQAGGPYVGNWGAHGEHVVVNADGSGTETSNYGTVNFKMTFVSTSDPTASGNVTGGAKQAGLRDHATSRQRQRNALFHGRRRPKLPVLQTGRWLRRQQRRLRRLGMRKARCHPKPRWPRLKRHLDSRV